MQHESTNICKPTNYYDSTYTNYYDPNLTKYYDSTKHDNAWSRWRIIISLWFTTRRKPQYSHIYFLFHYAPNYYKSLCNTSCAKLRLKGVRYWHVSDTGQRLLHRPLIGIHTVFHNISMKKSQSVIFVIWILATKSSTTQKLPCINVSS